jgi:hypothetical protein
MTRRRPIGRRLVLDNEAASALLRGPSAKRRRVIEALAAADGGALAPFSAPLRVKDELTTS